VRCAVDPQVSDLGHPLDELLGEVTVVDEDPAGQEVALEVLHAGLDLPFGLSSVGLAESGLEAPVVGKGPEGGIPEDPPLLGSLTDRARPIVEVLPRVPAKVLEGPFVGVEELWERLVGARDIGAAAAVPQGEDKDVAHRRLLPEVDGRCAPVDLALESG